MSEILVQATNLYLSYGMHTLFEEISFSINGGEKFALIGENGVGKSTLLQILSGKVQSESGRVERAPNVTVALLPQEIPIVDRALSAREYILEGSLVQLERRMSALEDQLEDPLLLAEWGELQEEYVRKGGYRRPPIEEVLSGLKLELELDLPMAQLSSGQRVRVALAKALIESPDLLFLDEPTNHLDLEMIVWLKDMLIRRKEAVVIVTHDRMFLNAVCNRLIELKDGRLTSYVGNYDFYLEEKERLLTERLKDYKNQIEEKKILTQKIQSLNFSARRHSGPSDRNVMAYDKRGEKHQKSLQRSLDTYKKRLEENEANAIDHPLQTTINGLVFPPVPLASNVAIEIIGVSKSFGHRVLFSHVSKMLSVGDRIVLMGPNGCGKTTLLRLIMQLESVDSGVIRHVPSAKIAYLDQEVELLPMDKTPLDYFGDRFALSETDVRKELHKAGLGGADLLNIPFSQLSVGQRKRLMLLSLVLSRPNVLVLDEPTNHLDFPSLEALEKALLDFKGALLFVSHDQAFINKIATDSWRLSAPSRVSSDL